MYVLIQTYACAYLNMLHAFMLMPHRHTYLLIDQVVSLNVPISRTPYIDINH